MIRCGTCSYWQLHPRSEDKGRGACKRYPPQPNIQLMADILITCSEEDVVTNEKLNTPHFIWWSYPVVDADMPCCGEYNPEVKQ